MGFKARKAKMSLDRRNAKSTGVRVAIYREMKAAHQAGWAWTEYRPFLDGRERLGAMRCCNVSCNQPSVYVSYAIGILPGRVVLCEKHHSPRNLTATPKNN